MNHFLRTIHLLLLIATFAGCTPDEQETFDIINLSQTSGPVIGNSEITITGSDFSYIEGVRFGDSECTNVAVVNASKITCTIPAHASGAVTVVVYGRVNRSASTSYTYLDSDPSISSFIPAISPLNGGINLSITGSQFLAGATVTVGGTACTGVVVVSATQISCILPTKAVGSYAIVVTNVDSSTVTSTSSIAYMVTPTVTSVSPSSGILAGGALLTVTGSNFLAGAVVTIGATNCPTPIVVNATTITCILPAKATGTYNVLVTNTNNRIGSLSSAFFYRPFPTIAIVAPAKGIPTVGTNITLYGTGFMAGAAVTIGGTACNAITVVSATVITCTTPLKAPGVYDIVITNSDTQFVTKVNGFTYSPPPTLVSVSPDEGALAGDSTLTITGTAFVEGATVLIGVTPCTNVSVVGPTTATCTLPALAAGTYSLTFTNPDTQSANLPLAYTYQDAPTVTSVVADSGALAGGTSVTINGTGFLAGATVDFDGSDCVTGLITPTTIACTTTAHIEAAVTVMVTNTDGQSGTLAAAYTYRPAPTVTSVLATSGLQAGGLGVTITGTGFFGSDVDFAAAACTGVTVVSDTSITCTTPANGPGVVAITVTNSDGQFGSLAGAFTYTAIPVLEFIVGAISPNPPNPDDYGSTAIAVTHTFTLTNTGEAATSAITMSVTDPAAYDFGTDNCTAITLAVAATCTVQLTFRGDLLLSGSINPATLEATAVSGGTAGNDVTGAVP